MSLRKYWIATISKEHADLAKKGGFIQVCHGKEKPLKRMKKNDFLLIYSSKIKMEYDEKCQTFTAVGKVIDDEVYQFKMKEDFIPFRRNILFLDSEEISIIPLIESLEFISDKKYWGYPFRYGFFEIKENDFKFIASKMISNNTLVDL